MKLTKETIAPMGAERLEAIRERMGMTVVDFRTMLRISKDTYTAIKSGKHQCRILYVEIAESKLKAFLRKEKAQLRKQAKLEAELEAVTPKTIVEIEPDPAMKIKVISLHIRGRDKATIASTLALSPAVVDYYLKGLENIDAEG